MLPTPDYPLDDACSTLFNNTLYTYTSQAFQSLSITPGAEWANLSMGVPVQGGVCVKSTPLNATQDAALYIVGGTSNSSDYSGLQRYTFANKSWESVKPTVAVTQGRLYHGAVYLNSSDTILVFAGTQDGTKQPSTQTFTIQASEPYTVLAYEAMVPPAISPLLMQWTESKAMYIGGSSTNTKAMIFSPSDSWVDSNATLADPIYDTSNIKAAKINGDDGSKSVYTFDTTVSPNAVNRTILIDADGNPIQNAQPIVSENHKNRRSAASSEKLARDLTVSNWPSYNDTLAPTSTRTSYSLAQDQSGLVVISGGNTEDVLCMFKARDNCWANATAILEDKSVSQQAIATIPSSTPSTTATSATSATQTPSASATAAAAAASDPSFPIKVLAGVLGSILGIAFLLIAILALLRCRAKRRQLPDAGHQRRTSGIPDEKDMDFFDRGLPEMNSTRKYPGHGQHTSNGSFSSMAILMGKVSHKRGSEKGSFGSNSSSQFDQKYKTTISNPIPQEQAFEASPVPVRPARGISFHEEPIPVTTSRPPLARNAARGSTRRSSGWNRYWSGGSALNVFGFGSKRTTIEGPDRDSGSHYSEQRLPSQVTQNSAMIPPLKIGVLGEQLNRVPSGSPTVSYQSANFPLSREKSVSAQIERPGSTSTVSSYNDDRHDAFSSGIPASVNEQNSWDPVGGERGVSEYSASVYTSAPGRDTMATNYQRDTRFQTPPPPRGEVNHNSDMSWLNLGAGSRI